MIAFFSRYKKGAFIFTAGFFLIAIFVGLGSYLGSDARNFGAVAIVGKDKIPYSKFYRNYSRALDNLREKGLDVPDALEKQMKQEIMIEIRGLTKVFGELKAVDNLSVSVKPGEIFGFLGPNGAGKTTTVKILSGLMHPTEGEVIVGGYNVVTHPIEAKKIMALVPDEPFVYPKLTGVEFMYFVGDLYGVSRSRQKTEIPKLLSMIGNAVPPQLSKIIGRTLVEHLSSLK